MSTALFPDGLTRTAWDDLQYRCKAHDEDREHWAINSDPAKGWAIREANLITIGALTGPESHTLPGWTRREWTYHYHVPAQHAQILAADAWGEFRHEWCNPTPSSPSGSLRFEALYFRDPDGKSAPVDANGLAGWTLYTVPVIAPKWEKVAHPNPTSGGFVSAPFELTPPMVTAPTTPAPQPLAVKVGDRVLVELNETGHVAYVHEITPAGRVLVSAYSQSKGEEFWFAAEKVLEVLTPRATEG